MNLSLYGIRNAWFHWVNASVNRKIFSAAVIVAIMTLLVKAVGFVKELSIAYQFGAGDVIGAFYIAWNLPVTLTNISTRAFKIALMPSYYEEMENKGQEAANYFVTNALFWCTGLMVGIAGLLALCAPAILPLMASGFSAGQLALAHSLFLILLVSVVISGISGVWGAILNANNRFALVSSTPAIVSIVTVGMLLWLGHTWGIYALAIGLLLGFALEAVVLGWQLHRVGVSLRPQWPRLDPAMKQVIQLFWPTVLSSFMMGSTTLVDQSIAGMLGPESVANLAYGNKLVLLTVSMSGLALNTATLPYVTRMATRNEWRNLRHTLSVYSGLIALVTIPLTMVFFLFSEPILALFFQRGAFTAEDVHQVAQIQAMYALQIPFYLLSLLISRAIIALKMHYFFIFGAILTMITNIVLDVLFLHMFGLKGIALSTSGVYLVSWIVSSFIAYYGIRRQERALQQTQRESI